MPKLYPNSLKFRMLARLRTIQSDVILRKDVEDMGGPRQISRALKALIEMGELIKIGYGVYAKTCRSPYLNKPIIKEGFETACVKALDRLGVKWEVGSAQQAYNEGRSTQVPVRTIVHLKSRFRRHLSYGNRELIIERSSHARRSNPTTHY